VRRADATRAALLSSRDVIADLHERNEGTGPVMQLVDRVQRVLERMLVTTFGAGVLLGAAFIWASRYFRRGGGGRRGPPGGEPTPREPPERAVDRPSRLDPSPTRAT